MSYFAEALSSGFDAIESIAGETVTYTRGQLTATVTATMGQSETEDIDGGGQQKIVSRSIDWLIRPDDLALDGDSIQPSVGDRITSEDGRVFDVSLVGGSVWRWSDARRNCFRIHTVEATP